MITRSGLPSPLKSPTSMYQGKPPPEAKYMFFAGWKVPSPLPSSTQAVQSPKLTTARSGLPSPLKSLTTMPEGPFLDPATYSVWGLNNGVCGAVCANVGFGDASRKNEVAATSNDNLPNFLFMEHQTDEFERHATQLQKQPDDRSPDLLSAPNQPYAHHKIPRSCSSLSPRQR